jgi:hypothetical protein
MQLTMDCRSGVRNHDIQVADVDVSGGLSHFEMLDGVRHTLMVFERPDGCQIMIGGGPLWYIVTLDDGKNSLTLQNPNGSETEMVELCAGGQFGEYPASFCVDQSQAGAIISLFFGGAEASAAWA